MLSDAHFQQKYNTLSNDEKNVLQSWIKDNFKPINSINRKHGSYALKHDFEKSQHGFPLQEEAFIVAMLEAGYDVDKENSLSCSFNISQQSIKNIRHKNEVSASDLPEDLARLDIEQQQQLFQWIKDNLQMINSFNNSVSSDHLRDLFEQMTNVQITNGMMKGAMLKTGFKIRKDMYFNVSSKSISRIYWEEL